MKFQQGYDPRRAKGGRRPGAGRPRKVEAEAKAMVERIAAELAKQYLENHLKPVLDTYISLATGQKIGRVRCKLDPATCRHAVERFIPPAPRALTLEHQKTAEDFYEEIMKEAEGGGNGQPEAGEPEGGKPPKDKSKLH